MLVSIPTYRQEFHVGCFEERREKWLEWIKAEGWQHDGEWYHKEPEGYIALICYKELTGWPLFFDRLLNFLCLGIPDATNWHYRGSQERKSKGLSTLFKSRTAP